MTVLAKIKALLSSKKQFFALSYSWSSRSIVVHKTQDDYFTDLIALRQEQGVAKRSEFYIKEFVKIKNKEYAVYLSSYGDIRKGKFMYGENPIAKEFGICMFDFAYLFLEEKQMVFFK